MFRTGKIRKAAIMLPAIALALSLALTGCGSSNSNSEGETQGAAQSEKPLEVSIMTILLSSTPTADDNPLKLAIEKATNSKMNIQWVSGNNYADKLNVTLASGDIPNIILINDPFTPVFRNAVSQGAFWDVTPYIKDYANLNSKISETAWQLTKMEDGKNYGVPRPRPEEADSFFVVRKDWLDSVGMKEPATMDEFYQVLKAFSEKNPSKTGQKDIVPFAAYLNSPLDMGALNQVENSFTGVNGKWKYINDQLVNVNFLPEMRKAIEFETKLYKEKLIPEDFASLKLSQVGDMFKAGKAGMIVEKAGTMTEYYNTLKKVDPSFKEADFYPLTSIDGYNPKGTGFSGILAIPKSVPEAKMKQILGLVDTWMNDDVFAIQQYGFEGQHYKVENGKKIIDKEALDKDGASNFNQIVYVADPYASSTKINFPDEVNKLYASIQDERAKTSVADIATGLYSPTAQTFLPEFDKKVTDLKTKIILGREPMTAWDDFVTKMKDDPDMVKLSQELTEAYKQRISSK
ncbi:extracellular solute-binding protein [Paenibacillus sepulcri]|uniref:Extracellular solute-binding protein n=1 Tax=Paenibacillus sepulcri TaxID=359917 RepID=A0ABS7C9U3_9BACL|nr:extracellular solute-binding protein [Paenibacillus sepulcri]